MRLLSADDAMDTKVRNPQGEDLGEIKNLMVDLNTGRIIYAVLTFGGVLGMGEKLYAVPWEALAARPEREGFVLNMDREQLENAPAFREDEWPMHGDWELVEPTRTAAYYTAAREVRPEERAAAPAERVEPRAETWEERQEAAKRRDEERYRGMSKEEIRSKQAAEIQALPRSMRPSTGRDIPGRGPPCAAYEQAKKSPDYDREWLEGMFTWFGAPPYWCE